MDGKQTDTDVLQLVGIISMIASIVLGLLWVFTQWLA